MTREPAPSVDRELSPLRAIVWCTAIMGTLDISDAWVFAALRGVMPGRVLQGIASGLLGRASYQNGIRSQALGLAIHFFIACCVSTTYILASRRIKPLRDYPLVCGPLYGIGVWLFMNFVVIRFTFGPPRFALPGVINGLAIHMVCVGLIPALFAHAVRAGARGRVPLALGAPGHASA